MINETAMANFDWLWETLVENWDKFGGTMYRIWPFDQYFSKEFANGLTEEKAERNLHEQLREWGRIRRKELHFEEVLYRDPIGDTATLRPIKSEPGQPWSWWFIVTAFYNLCCLAIHRDTIEKLIFDATQYLHLPHPRLVKAPEKERAAERIERTYKAFKKLVGVSKSFLLAEWTHEMVDRAISNKDRDFFKHLSRALTKDSINKQTMATARVWLGTMLLWYLGGKDIHPRKEFWLLLRQKKILTKRMEMEAFLSMLSNLHLTKNLGITK